VAKPQQSLVALPCDPGTSGGYCHLLLVPGFHNESLDWEMIRTVSFCSFLINDVVIHVSGFTASIEHQLDAPSPNPSPLKIEDIKWKALGWCSTVQQTRSITMFYTVFLLSSSCPAVCLLLKHDVLASWYVLSSSLCCIPFLRRPLINVSRIRPQQLSPSSRDYKYHRTSERQRIPTPSCNPRFHIVFILYIPNWDDKICAGMPVTQLEMHE